jgi:23S rRNA pseudouridine1911/1915/1917 synthase
MAVVASGKPARTHVAIVERFGIATLLRVTLETGRTHQIRVHLAAIGHPLVGDPAYGGRGQRRNSASTVPARADRSRSFVSDPKMGDFPRQALHATRLSLPHPRTNESMSWESQPPADFANLVRALRSSRSAAQ